MTHLTALLLCYSCFFGLTWAATGLYLRVAARLGFMDIPNERSSHRIPTPRGGGLAFTILCAMALVLAGGMHLFSASTCLGLASGFLVAAVGFWDDRWKLSASIRFLAHLVSAIWTLYWLGFCRPPLATGEHTSVTVAAIAAIATAFVWCINLTNFMDGIDGIAGSQMLVVSGVCGVISLAFFPGPGAALWFVIAAGAAGFLLWNWHPAKIFMGDVGSGFFGFAIAATVAVQVGTAKNALWPPLIMMAVFSVDATATLLRRFFRGEKWYAPHRQHAFQRASDRFGQLPVVQTVIGVNILWLAPLALCSAVWPRFGLALALLAYAPVLVLQQSLTKTAPLEQESVPVTAA